MKITLIISNNTFYRNYINRFVIDELKQISNLKIISNNDVIDKKKKIDFICEENITNIKLHKIIAGIRMFANIEKSKSFKYRIQRRYQPKTIKNLTFRSIAKYFKIWIYYFLFKIFSFNKFISRLTENFLRLFLKINYSLIETIKRIDSDIVLMPTNGFNSFELDAECTLNKFGINYISLVDNWDNLSSKTILLYKANHYGVWGEQSRIHAKNIQNIDYKKTSSIGTPRFEFYRNCKIKKLFDFKYILFVGTTVQFDEFSILKKLNNILIKNNIDIKIIYRPHPWRESTNFSDLTSLNKVILDPQISEQYTSKSSSDVLQPELDLYADIISGAEFVIGGMTTMLIEAYILKRHFIALAHSEPGNKLGPKEMLNGYTHFAEVSSLKNITIISDISELENIIVKKIKEKQKFLEDEYLNHFIDYSNETYGSKLIKLIKENLNNDK